MLNYGNMQPYQAQNIPNYYHTQNVQIRPIMQNPVIMPNPVTMPSQVIIQNPVIKANPVNIQNPVIMQNPVNFQNPVIMQKPVMMPNSVIAPNPSNMQTFHNLQNMQMIPKIPNNQKIVSQADFVDCNKAVPINIIIKALKSICKIAIRGNYNVNATGFFMKISDTEKYLITNNHVINQNNIYDNIEIEIHNQKKMKLNLNNREVKYFPKPKDITMIEIKTTDNIYNDILFLDYDLNFQKGYYIYQNAIIFLIQHPGGKNAEYASGKIVNINNFEFDHNIGTKSGASGSPIILFNENIDSIQVIGIHKEANYTKLLNIGTFIGEIFKKENINIINNNNYIIAEIDIKDDDINKDIRIINSYEEYKRNAYNKEIEKELMNEEEIKRCEIRINNQLIPFNYFFKFTNKGKYIIKYSFNNYLTNANHMFCECSSLTDI